jgi:hypothetical protein
MSNGAAVNDAPADPTPGSCWPQGLLTLALCATIALAMVCATALVVAHARDRYWVNVASGSWLALAWTANHGELYPPLRDEAGNFAGTRYMPLYVMAHAALARVTGEYLFSGKLISIICAGGWFAGIIVLARQRGASRIFAAALAASVALAPVGIQALCTIRSDGLALALQLWALWIAGRIARERGVALAVLAAALCALAFLAKLTAVWAPVAIGAWLLWRNRLACAAFVATGIAVSGAALAMLHVITDGRMLENLMMAGGSGWQGFGSVLIWSQQRLLSFVWEWSPTTWLLAPAAMLAVLLAMAQRDVQPIHLAWIACCAAMAIMFADIGVGENHVLELAAITAVLAGDLWARAGVQHNAGGDGPGETRWTIAQMLLAVSVCWSSFAVFKQRMWTDLLEAITTLRTGEVLLKYDPHALEHMLAGKTFLSDDPSVAVLLDQKPLISDAFIFRRFETSHPQWFAEIMDRINRREFDVIVLMREPDPQSWWYSELFLGRPVLGAIITHYRLDQQVGAHRVFVKKDV